MTFQLASFILVLSACYFVSRLALRLPHFPSDSKGLRLAHLASGVALMAMVALLKFWTPGFAKSAAIKIAICQVLWLGYDHLRGRRPGRTLG